ncbi:MarR family winged helix-turn-helix transcriptional regulator [Streptomyces sp. NBC_00287]|uniref:MarR family winged helix-turn-helix transcriptional regulator n=1 Tax=Streptomyces sp. NBC_00287 TaxID=2975702 RepID=UPI002E2E8732|nr:MarR family transcriptional regulator [Streptomyces sp. NBC_00287]
MPPPPTSSVSEDIAEIEHALTRITYLAARARQHERLMAVSGLSLDRAAAAIVRHLAALGEPLRPGVLAVRLSVEASHVTRQLHQLERAGYVSRQPDPDDRRAQRIQLTAAGSEAADRMRAAGRRGMTAALAGWSAGDLHVLPLSSAGWLTTSRPTRRWTYPLPASPHL